MSTDAMGTDATTTDTTSTDGTVTDGTATDGTVTDGTSTAAAATAAVNLAPPRTRWAAIVWGTLFAAIAATAFWLLIDDDRRSAVTDWSMSLAPTTVATLAILTVGVLLLVAGAVGLLRRGQRRMAARTASSARAGDILTQ